MGHLQIKKALDKGLLLRLKPHLNCLEVSFETLKSVIDCEELMLNKFVINDLDMLGYYDENCFKGLVQINSKSTELKSRTFTLRQVFQTL